MTIALIGWGVMEVRQLPIDAVPDITDNQVQIITVSPALGATDIERVVTIPIEQGLSNIPGRKEIRSFSRFGLSLITIVFDDNTNVYWARQQIAERLQQLQGVIPPGIGTPTMAPVTTGLGEIYQYTVRPAPGFETKYSLSDLRTIQDWTIRKQLLGTPGVADVSSFGGNLKQYEISIQPEWLASRGITLQDLNSALEKNNANTGGSYIDKGPQALFIRTEGLAKNVQDLEQVVVGYQNNSPVYLRDVATVQEGRANRYGAVCYNDQGEAVGAVVMMLKGANSSDVIAAVKTRMEEIKKTLPEGILVEPFLDRTKMVNNAIHTVETNLMEGALIVIFVIVLFIGQMRAGLLVASVIPLSMLFAVGMMNLFGVSGNLMSLGAIDFGMIVDGTVIIIEAIMHTLTHHKRWKEMQPYSQEDMNVEVKTASSRILNSAVFGQLIILIVYLPLLTLTGIEGKMFRPMAQTITFAIIGAFLLSLTYVPMMASLVLPKQKKSNKVSISDRMMIFIEKHYQHSLERIFKRSRIVIIATLSIFVLSVFVASRLGGEFIPKLEEGDLAVDTRVMTGSNLNTTIEYSQKAAHEILTQFPEVEKVVTKIGSGEIPTDPMPLEAADMMVILKPKKEWTSAKSYDELSEKMGKAIANVPGVSAGFQFPVQMRFNELMTGARQDVVCKIFGEDLDSLTKYAEKLAHIAEGIDGVKDVYVESVNGMPQAVISLKHDQLAKYQITVEEANRWIETAFAGKSVGAVYEGEKRFDIVIRSDKNFRADPYHIGQLLITNRNNTAIPLSAIADIQLTDGVNQVQREDTRRRIIVGFNVRGRDIQSVVHDVQKGEEKEIKFPAGYRVVYGGTFENLQAAQDRLSVVVPIALSMIFLLLFFALGSVKDSILVYSAIPLSAIGGIFTLYLTGTNFSISAGVGFIALFGVAVLEGILMIAEFKRLESEGWHDYPRIAQQGTKIRLRSVLMTALAPSLGFIPMAISQGAGAEVQRPLALVVIGGLVSATILTLYVLPILYVWQRTKQANKLKKNHVAAVAVMALLFTSQVHAQVPNDLSSLLQLADANHPGLAASRAHVEAMQANATVFRNWQPLSVSNEYGNINSMANDHRISITESFRLPGYSSSLFQQQQVSLDKAKIELKRMQSEVKRNVERAYFNVQILNEKIRLQNDALARLTHTAELTQKRIDVGDETAYALLLIEQEKARVEHEKIQLEIERKQSLYELQLATGSKSEITLESGNYAYQWNANGSSEIQFLEEQIIAKDKLWYDSQRNVLNQLKKPTIDMSFNNMSIIGWQNITGQDMYYSANHRFTSLSAGITIPIAHKKQSYAVKATTLLANEQEMLRVQKHTELQNRHDLLQKQLIDLTQQANKFNEWSPTSERSQAINGQLNKQFETGNMNYMEWSWSHQNLLQTQLQFLNALQLLNNTKIELEYLLAE